MSGLPFRLTLLALVAALGFGCGSTAKPVVPVEGKVTFTDGTPLPAGTRVVLNPAEGVSKTASGKTADDGSFKLTHQTGRTGAEEGKYSIQLLAPEGDDGEFFKLVASEYTDGGKLSVEVKPGMAPLDLAIPKKTGKKN